MRRRTTAALAATLLPVAALSVSTVDRAAAESEPGRGVKPDREVRFATFNASLNREKEGQLVEDLSGPDNEQARNVAETIQRVDADVVLINEFDYVPGAVDLFRENYLEQPQRGADPVRYPYAFVAPVNTGVATGHDLDNNGTIGGGNDAHGFGLFPGQYGMVVLSKHPIVRDEVRTFRHFLWRDMPDAMLPDDPATTPPNDWYSAAELDTLRLSSKSHWDVPIRVGRRTVHFLTSHPTPPTFDGPEDRNGTRNHDEIRFWADYVTGNRRATYIYDDAGRRGGLDRGSSFVIAGDQNADPYDGDSADRAIWQLLDHPRINDKTAPTSSGAVEAAALQGGANADHEGDPATDTADFADTQPGNLRADYVLPSRGSKIRASGVFWPTTDDPLYRLTGSYPPPTSDHRMVWVDVTI